MFSQALLSAALEQGSVVASTLHISGFERELPVHCREEMRGEGFCSLSSVRLEPCFN